MPETLDKIIQGIVKMVEELTVKRYFSSEWLENIDYRQHNRLHSRILGIIGGVCTELGYIVDFGRGLKPSDGRKFNPDILLFEKKKPESASEKPVALIEYESSNSSDNRVLKKDLANYKRSVENPLYYQELP